MRSAGLGMKDLSKGVSVMGLKRSSGVSAKHNKAAQSEPESVGDAVLEVVGYIPISSTPMDQ